MKMQEDAQKLPKAVFFDVGSTLVHPEPSVAETFVAIARDRGHCVTLADVEPHMAAVDQFYAEEYLRDGDFWCSHERACAIWYDMYRYLAQLTGLERDAEGMAVAMREAYRHADQWALYGDVKPCLRALKKRGLLLGVISNWDDGLEDLLRRLKLLVYFDDVVSSAAVGYRKPDRVIFELALERLDVEAACAVHVGDLPEADGDGASSAGIRPVIVDRRKAHPVCRYECVPSLVPLPSLLQSAR